MLTIPTDLDSWHSNDISAWLTGLANDESVSDDEYAAAEAAVYRTLVSPAAEQLPHHTLGRAR